METVVSGIRPTGRLHLGNYFGALRNFVKMQNEHNCYFFIADYHSLTTHPTPENLQHNIKQVLAEYLVCGLDPEKCTLYIQSDLPETAELYLLLNMNTYMGELQKCASFKEKIRKQPENVNAGLLTYPTLMAADILIHNATKVPVGKDQEQHLEMTRKFAKRFNNLYKTDLFVEPQAYNFGKNLTKVPGLDGSGKMGKSEGENNAIFLTEEPNKIKKKIMRAVTDGGPTQKNQDKPEAIANLFNLLKLVSTQDTYDFFNTAYNNCEIRYGDLKKQLALNMIDFTEPFREKVNQILADDNYLKKVQEIGKEKAQISARKLLNEVRQIIGFKKFY